MVAALAKLAVESDKMEKSEKAKSKKERKSLLDGLDKNYDAELKGILANIHTQQEAANAEKIRQLRLAKIRRENKMLEKEEQNDMIGAFMREQTMISATTEKKLNAERANQQERTKKRLAQRKKRLEEMSEEAAKAENEKKIVDFFDEDAITV